jgi:hypothetical protein
MEIEQTTTPLLPKQTVGRHINTDSKSSPTFIQVCVEELTPLQRQRLDAAVMMLVNYLVSASSAA